MSKYDEEILVMDRVGLAGNEILTQFQDKNVVKVDSALDKKLQETWLDYGHVMKRGDCEENLMLIQPIPYVVLKQGNKYFTYKRLEGGGEERLHNKISCGLGGHCNLEEQYINDFNKLIGINTFREIKEEIKILGDGVEISDSELEFLCDNAQTIGLGYNEEDEVNAVHIGIFKLIELPNVYEVEVREKDTLEGMFLPKEQIENSNMENWTRDVMSLL